MGKPILRLLQLCLTVSILFAAWGFWAMMRPVAVPQVEPKASIGKYTYPRPQAWQHNNSEDILINPFASTPDLASSSSSQPAESVLILLGTLKGKNPQAIVAEKSNPAATRIVKQGDFIGGERIVKIGRGFVVVLKDGQRVRVSAK